MSKKANENKVISVNFTKPKDIKEFADYNLLNSFHILSSNDGNMSIMPAYIKVLPRRTLVECDSLDNDNESEQGMFSVESSKLILGSMSNVIFIDLDQYDFVHQYSEFVRCANNPGTRVVDALVGKKIYNKSITSGHYSRNYYINSLVAMDIYAHKKFFNKIKIKFTLLNAMGNHIIENNVEEIEKKYFPQEYNNLSIPLHLQVGKVTTDNFEGYGYVLIMDDFNTIDAGSSKVLPVGQIDIKEEEYIDPFLTNRSIKVPLPIKYFINWDRFSKG